jgi:ribose transport system ATP-binding protein
VASNISVASMRRYSSFGWLDRRRELADASAQVRALDIRPPDPRRPVKTLSGGNQQKIVLARWLVSGSRQGGATDAGPAGPAAPADAADAINIGPPGPAAAPRPSPGALRVLLLDEPTRGVDVGARAELYALIRALADQGIAVLLVSSEVPEVLGLADRVLVIREGHVIHEADAAELDEPDVLNMIMEGSAL